ncbi:TetR/AcrR family transcriptional regulator [Rhodococcus sp. IEGM 1406]|uniref:TetR/AcrR family transcriptional regulator n=1 Tax=Rhodococcus sp. IEGM 1406 TaxID=3047083 RepID=UPI0024B8482E|nr:TetR/AcrR family transcriptional regulator [Rhodococcus sp. IEGM 1406]MDI9904577.1 helix-turn-helix domain-containing protein [Rhodococcus sp. IEGM 1406]
MSRTEQLAQTRALLLSSARDEFEDRGYSAATLERIGERAGYHRTAVYKHFPSKENLFLAVLEEESEEHVSSAIASLQTTSRPVEAFTIWFVGDIAVARSLHRAKSEFFLAAVDDAALREKVAEIQHEVDTSAQSVVAELVAILGITPLVSIGELTNAVLALANGLAQRALVDTAMDLSGSLERAILALLRGVGMP